MNVFCVSVLSVLLCTVAAFAADAECPTDGKVVFCYYTSWSVYREDEGKFTVNDIDPFLCTHLIYAFSGLSIYGGIESFDPNSDITLGGYSNFIALKEKNPCLKTLLAIGGWNQASRKFSVMAHSPSFRQGFVDSALRFIVGYGFDGIDYDWEYPAARGGIAEDKENFAELLKLTKETFQKWDLMVTVAVPISTSIAEAAYDLNAVNKYADYVLIMGYDYTSTESKVTGWLSPITPIADSIQYWSKVVSPKKIVLGVPAYGRSFILLNPNDHGIGAPTNGSGYAGEFTREPGFLSYYEVVDRLLSRQYTIVQDLNALNCYAYYNTEWFVYESEQNYIAKAKYVLNNNLGGMMVWSLDTDDFRGMFNNTYAIVNTIRSALRYSKRVQ